jgi:hypothetical protein
MLVSSFILSQSFNYAPYLFCKKRFKSEINCFCIRTQGTPCLTGMNVYAYGKHEQGGNRQHCFMHLRIYRNRKKCLAFPLYESKRSEYIL